MARSFLVPAAKRWLYLIHCWIGVASCLLFLMWFRYGQCLSTSLARAL
ncbi:hypothetical protein K7957_10820 [Sphingomonas yunnanensis]|nr:hypothetical protein [Sphingomonas yunnanensis]MBY9063421.1 hypothetical protein [Sphingomonas yunnanensis]